MRSRAPYAIVLAFAVIWLAFHWNRLKTADPFADPVAMHQMPAQQEYTSAQPDPAPLQTFIEMADPAVAQFLLRDIAAEPDAAGRRWTFTKPALQFFLIDPRNQRFAMDFTIPDQVFRATGPVTLAISINGNLLDRVRCDHAGDFHFEKTVPDGWLIGRNATLIEASLDKVWTSPVDGARLGYQLSRAGFRN